MKKQLFLMSALALTTLASCGGQAGNSIKVGLICLHDKNSTYDANFIGAFESACEKAKQAGKISDYSYVTDVPEDDECYNAAERFVNQGYSIVFSDSYGHDPYMRKAAKEFPNVFFCSATGDKAIVEDDSPNYHNAFASIFDGRYLAGMAAGLNLKSNGHEDTADKTIKLGYVGAFPYAEVVSGFTSWYLGVKSVYKNAKVEMVVTYTSSWYDYDLEAAAAEKLITDGCVLISQHADSMGAPNTCKKEKIPNVSYNVNTAEVDPTCADTYVAHSRINWEPYYTEVLNTQVGAPVPGEKDHNWTGTLKTGSVEYNVSSKLVKEEDRKLIDQTAEKLKNGEMHVFDTSTFTYSGKDENAKVDDKGHLIEYTVNLNGDFADGAKVVNKQIVSDGYVHESEYRSAPSFALIIDGITELKKS